MIYFDITDLVTFSQSNTHPTGIQRVQIQIIKSAVESGFDLRCIFFDPKAGMPRSFAPPMNFFLEGDLGQFRRLMHNSRWLRVFPEKYEIKNYLRAYDNRKIIRGIKKLEVYASAVLSAKMLRSKGFKTGRAANEAIRKNWDNPVVAETLAQLPDGGVLVMLGAFWESPEMIDFAQRRQELGRRNYVLIHDIIPLVTPEFCGLGQQRNFKVAISALSRIASDLLAVSEWTANDFREHFKDDLGRLPIKVVRLAHEMPGFERNASRPLGKMLNDLKINEHGFVLCVGTIEARKNPILLVRAWVELHKRLGEATPKLVLAGKWGWRLSEFNNIFGKNKQIEPYISVKTSATDDELAALYGAALFTVFPSYYEGWGLPVGEAAWMGKLCLASNRSSVPEVVGDLAVYVDPEDVDGFVEKAMLLLTDEGALREREAKIRSAPLRTWKDVAQDLVSFVEKNST